MRYSCSFVNNKTGEQKDLISKLDPDEIAAVERVRLTDGEDQALIIAACIVLKSAYSELNAGDWSHLFAPIPVN